MGNPMEQCSDMYEYLVVGAGPAGVQCAYYLEKLGRKYTVLEAGEGPCTFFTTYPRHRTLISINKRFNSFPEDEFNMRHDWNSLLSDDPEMRFTKYSDKLFPPADRLVQYVKDFVKKFNLKIKFSTKVNNISRAGEEFMVKTECGTVYRTQVVIMACGGIKENIPDIPGVELAKTYGNHDINQTLYENKEVCIVGGGNSGFETADHLCGHASIIHVLNESPFKLAWDTHFPGNLRAINNSIIDMFHLKSLHALRVGQIKKIEEIERDGKKKLKLYFDVPMAHWDPPCTGHLWGVYDEVILCTGFKYVLPDIFDKNCTPDITPCGRFATLNSKWESTNVKNLFFAGTCTQVRDKRAASSFIHGFRYSARTLTYLLNHLQQNEPLRMETYNNIDMEQIVDFMIKRFSTSSALYQLNYGVLCDVMIFDPAFEKGNASVDEGRVFPGSLKYFYELPMAWVLEQEHFTSVEDMWILIFKDHRASFPSNMSATEFALPPDLKVSNQLCTGFIGPLIYRYKKGKLIEEYNLGGNLIARPDSHQLAGDEAPYRAQNKIRNLLMKQLEIKGAFFDEKLYSDKNYAMMYTEWTREEIEKERKNRKMKEMMGICNFNVFPTPQ